MSRAKPKVVSGWFFSATHCGRNAHVVYCSDTKRGATEWARNLRMPPMPEMTGPIVKITVPAPTRNGEK